MIILEWYNEDIQQLGFVKIRKNRVNDPNGINNRMECDGNRDTYNENGPDYVVHAEIQEKVQIHNVFYSGNCRKWFLNSSFFLIEVIVLFLRIVSVLELFSYFSPFWYSYHFLWKVPSYCPFVAQGWCSSCVCKQWWDSLRNRIMVRLHTFMKRSMVCILS